MLYSSVAITVSVTSNNGAKKDGNSGIEGVGVGFGLAVIVGLGEGDGLGVIVGVGVGVSVGVGVGVGINEGEGVGLVAGIAPVQDVAPEYPVTVHLALTVIVGVPETGPML